MSGWSQRCSPCLWPAIALGMVLGLALEWAWLADISLAAEADQGASTIQVITREDQPAPSSTETSSPAAVSCPPQAGAASVDSGADSAADSSGDSAGEMAGAAVAGDGAGGNEHVAPAESALEEPSKLPGQSPRDYLNRGTGEVPSEPGHAASEPLRPIPDPQSSDTIAVETASFNGITPGLSTVDNVQDAWGPPKEIANKNGQLLHLYRVEPFEQVEVSFVQGKVAAVVIRLDRAFPANLVAEKLELGRIRPVLISDELGNVLGEAFPERGVLFAFEPSDAPGKASMKVSQIVLEPVSAEAFVLRAETDMDARPEMSLRDLEEAIRLAPDLARAHWLRARLLEAGGSPQTALEACGEAVRLEPGDGQYRLTRAEILGQLGRFAEAIEEAEKARGASVNRPHVKARALCLLGDLASSQPEPDYRRALEYHMEAIKAADPLSVSRHPAIRIAAKQVLIDAHLGAAHDIAWGPWDEKEKAVPRWLEQAAAVARDMRTSEAGSADVEFRVAARALAALVGMRGRLDPARWAEEALGAGQQLIASAADPQRKQRLRWDLGLALYDAVQIYQMRGDDQNALSYGTRAAGYLQPDAAAKALAPGDMYLLGRLYFRLGAIYAVGKHDHTAAVSWFEKALPLFDQSAEKLAQAEFGRLGETYVSMGVSYWESGERDRGVRLTQRGVELMEQAVTAGSLAPTALEVPYNNLATMARHQGNSEQAERYLQQAKSRKQGTLR